MEHFWRVLRTTEGVIGDMSKSEVTIKDWNWFSTQLGKPEYGGPQSRFWKYLKQVSHENEGSVLDVTLQTDLANSQGLSFLV